MLYSKTCVKRLLKIDKTKILMVNGSLMNVESIAECSPWSILQYFWPALSDNRFKKIGLLFEWLLKTGFTVHYLYEYEGVCKCCWYEYENCNSYVAVLIWKAL